MKAELTAVNSEAGELCRWGGHVEGLRRKRGDAAGKLGASLLDRHSVDVGTIRDRPTGPGIQSGPGRARRRLMADSGSYD
ncbi:hypothetical protein GCM10010502_71010 [Kitasatospora aureofaciens]|uniref:Uncharacterized protein n=1 Tax=Kitasatospora aureofaciens TaxID=1894 RepID=A0A8H9I5E5_KITAU|nr:hypothetical protein GCM10010502_71010 [Kitasatospora aureofaciens]